MNTRQLTYVLSIAETGNLSAAAKELGVSQPALSKYLAELEDELGTELFLRYKKQLYPTAAGKIYLEAATRIIGVKEQTYQIISELSNGYQKTLHIGVTPLRGSIAIAQIFNQFHRRYPNVKIEMKERYMAGLRRAIQDHSVELALGTCNDPDEPDIIHTSFHEEELVLFVPSFHPLAYQASQDLDHLTAIDIRKFQDTPFLLATENSTIRQTAEPDAADRCLRIRQQPDLKAHGRPGRRCSAAWTRSCGAFQKPGLLFFETVLFRAYDHHVRSRSHSERGRTFPDLFKLSAGKQTGKLPFQSECQCQKTFKRIRII